jgi:hypothetical protein
LKTRFLLCRVNGSGQGSGTSLSGFWWLWLGGSGDLCSFWRFWSLHWFWLVRSSVTEECLHHLGSGGGCFNSEISWLWLSLLGEFYLDLLLNLLLDCDMSK